VSRLFDQCVIYVFVCNFEEHFEKHVLLMRRLLRKRHASQATATFFQIAGSKTQFEPSGGRFKIDSFSVQEGFREKPFLFGCQTEGPKSRFQVFVEGS
jgi:hypothetical protein